MTPANLKKVAALSDVVEGKKKLKKLKPKDAARYKAADFLTVGNLVAIDVGPGDRLTTKSGHIVKWPKLKKNQSAEVIIPASVDDLNDYFDALDDKHLNALKGKGEKFAFQFFGNNSNSAYFNVAQLRADLMAYRAVIAASEGKGEYSEKQVLQNIKIVRVNDKKEFPDTTWPRGYWRKNRKVSRTGRNVFEQGSKEAVTLGADRQKVWRKNLSAAKKKKYNADAKKRMRKLRRSKKNVKPKAPNRRH